MKKKQKKSKKKTKTKKKNKATRAKRKINKIKKALEMRAFFLLGKYNQKRFKNYFKIRKIFNWID